MCRVMMGRDRNKSCLCLSVFYWWRLWNDSLSAWFNSLVSQSKFWMSRTAACDDIHFSSRPLIGQYWSHDLKTGLWLVQRPSSHILIGASLCSSDQWHGDVMGTGLLDISVLRETERRGTIGPGSWDTCLKNKNDKVWRYVLCKTLFTAHFHLNIKEIQVLIFVHHV